MGSHRIEHTLLFFVQCVFAYVNTTNICYSNTHVGFVPVKDIHDRIVLGCNAWQGVAQDTVAVFVLIVFRGLSGPGGPVSSQQGHS